MSQQSFFQKTSQKVIIPLFTRLGIPTKGLAPTYIKNTAIVGISNVLESLVSFLLVLLISRELGSVGLGQYSFIFGFVGLFFIFSDFGLSPLMIKDLSKDFSKANIYFSNILSAKFILTSLSFLIYVVTLFFIGQQDIFLSLIIAGLIMFFRIMGNLALNLLTIKTKGIAIALASIIERVVALVAGVVVLYVYQSLTLFIVVLLGSMIIKSLLLFLFSRQYVSYKFELNTSFLWSLMKKGFPFVFIGAFTLAYAKLDTVMLGFMKTYEVVGWYNAGYKLIDMLAVLPVLLLLFGFPMLSKLFKKNKTHAKILFENLLNYVLLLAVPIAVGIYFVGNRILEFVYGFGAIESFYAFQILGVALIFIYISTIMGYVISSADKQHVFAWISGIGAVLNIILNILLIPKFSLYGAAIATVLTYFLMFIVMFFYVRKHLFHFRFKILTPVIGSLMMGFVIYWTLHLHLFLIIALSVLVYTLVVACFLLFEKYIIR